MFRVDPLSDAPESAQQCASTKRSVVESFPYVAKKGIVTEVVQGATLDTLFRETGVTNPDLLFVDAEGCDYDILTQLADSSVTPPPFMVLEHDHMTGSQITSSNQILDAMGYQIDQLTHDLVAFRA
jgi:FkbM family methyltransferase